MAPATLGANGLEAIQFGLTWGAFASIEAPRGIDIVFLGVAKLNAVQSDVATVAVKGQRSCVWSWKGGDAVAWRCVRVLPGVGVEDPGLASDACVAATRARF
jgi:hypothetical protein